MNSPPPSPRLTELEIDQLVERYAREMARYEKAAQVVAERLRRELRAEARLRHMISFRAKHPDDLRGKLRRKAEDPRYSLKSLSKDMNTVVTDLAGCRVVVYAPEDEPRVVDLIDRKFSCALRDDARPEPYVKPGGYRATHRLVLAASSSDDVSIVGAICEIQVTTLAAHLFNELEHDIAYKDDGQQPSLVEKNFLEDVRRLAEMADRQVDRLISARRDTVRAHDALDGPEALRFALEHEAGRPLAGDFVRLYRLLDSTLSSLSRAAVSKLGGVGEVLSQGTDEAARLGVDEDDLDDVVRLVLGWVDLREEFAALANSWRGPRTALSRALKKLRADAVDTSGDADHNGGEHG